MIPIIWIWAYPAPRFSPKYPPIPLAAETLVPAWGSPMGAGMLPLSLGSPIWGMGLAPELPAMGWGGATIPAAAPGVPLGAGKAPEPHGSPAGGTAAVPEPLGSPKGGA